MNQCLTLVANQPTSTEQIVGTLNEVLTIFDIQPRKMAATKNASRVWNVICPPQTTMTTALRVMLYRLKLDFALQAADRPTKKLFLSDMDATIVVGETIDDMAKTLGVYQQISAITAAAMRGELGYRQALRQRLDLMKGIHKSTVADIAAAVKLTDGADKLLAEINRRGMDSCLISGGFTVFTYAVSQRLGFNRHLANRLSYDSEGCLDGHWLGDLVSAEVKASTLKTLATENHIGLAETIAIGDGANDKLLLQQAGLGVAFYGKPVLREVANAEIHSGTIDNLLHFL